MYGQMEGQTNGQGKSLIPPHHYHGGDIKITIILSNYFEGKVVHTDIPIGHTTHRPTDGPILMSLYFPPKIGDK